jgi:hypothetical protein
MKNTTTTALTIFEVCIGVDLDESRWYVIVGEDQQSALAAFWGEIGKDLSEQVQEIGVLGTISPDRDEIEAGMLYSL